MNVLVISQHLSCAEGFLTAIDVAFIVEFVVGVLTTNVPLDIVIAKPHGAVLAEDFRAVMELNSLLGRFYFANVREDVSKGFRFVDHF